MEISTGREYFRLKKQTLGTRIAELRKEHAMTQLNLAEKMGVTDKAVSKWERDLSCPDVSSLPRLAEILEVSIDELMQTKPKSSSDDKKEKIRGIMSLILKAIPLAMGVSLLVLSAMKKIDLYSGFSMAGIGLACIAFSLLQNDSKPKR